MIGMATVQKKKQMTKKYIWKTLLKVFNHLGKFEIL